MKKLLLLISCVIGCACTQPASADAPRFIQMKPADPGMAWVPQPIYGILAADMNGDGKLDLLAFDWQWVSVLLGNGDGTFQNAVVTDGVFYELWGPSKAVGDLNRDGKLDLVVADQKSLVVLLGNGDGTFQSPVTYDLGADPVGVSLGDFNNDGYLDAVVGHLADRTYVSVLLGNGDGTFQAEQTHSTIADPVSFAVADFDGDGRADLVAGSRLGHGMSILRGGGDGTFLEAPVPTTDPSYVNSLLAKDLNRDGRPDLVVGGDTGISAWLGQADGSFTVVRFPSNQVYRAAFAAEDFDGDGTWDLLVANYATDYRLWLASGNGDGTFQPPITVYTNTQRFAHAIAGDFNGDGWPDIAVAYTVQDDLGQLHSYISLLLNAAALRLQAAQVNGNLQLSWPANLGNYQLQSSTSLDAAATWSDELAPPILSANRNVVTLQLGPGSKFFRLKPL
jgi:hypothetical protein